MRVVSASRAPALRFRSTRRVALAQLDSSTIHEFNERAEWCAEPRNHEIAVVAGAVEDEARAAKVFFRCGFLKLKGAVAPQALRDARDALYEILQSTPGRLPLLAVLRRPWLGTPVARCSICPARRPSTARRSPTTRPFSLW